MKTYNIGDVIHLPGAEDKIGLRITGYEYDEQGNITGYNVVPSFYGIYEQGDYSDPPTVQSDLIQ